MPENYKQEVIAALRKAGHINRYIDFIQEHAPQVYDDAFNEQLEPELCVVAIEEIMDRFVGKVICRFCGKQISKADALTVEVGGRSRERVRQYPICTSCSQRPRQELMAKVGQRGKG